IFELNFFLNLLQPLVYLIYFFMRQTCPPVTGLRDYRLVLDQRFPQPQTSAEVHQYHKNKSLGRKWIEQLRLIYAFVYFGSQYKRPDGLTYYHFEGDQVDTVDAEFGWSVASAGDVNGDGFDDVIIGAPKYENAQTTGGAVFVYLGSMDPINPSLVATSARKLLFVEDAINDEAKEKAAFRYQNHLYEEDI
ncbi:MAG: integrin alpha, partial [bacterium]